MSGKLSRADNNTGWCHCWCIGYSSSVKMWFVCCFCCLSLCCLRNILCDIYVVLQVSVTCGSLVCRVTFWCQLTALKWWTVNRRRASSQSLATGQFDDILSQFSVVIASIVCLWYFIICYFCYFSIHSWQTAILSYLCRVYIYCCDFSSRCARCNESSRDCHDVYPSVCLGQACIVIIRCSLVRI